MALHLFQNHSRKIISNKCASILLTRKCSKCSSKLCWKTNKIGTSKKVLISQWFLFLIIARYWVSERKNISNYACNYVSVLFLKKGIKIYLIQRHDDFFPRIFSYLKHKYEQQKTMIINNWINHKINQRNPS